MTDTTQAPDWENFAKAVLTDWPTSDLDGSVLFDLSLQYGMIKEVPGGYNSDHHIDANGICPEEGDPWYEYTFRGEAGLGLYSIADMNKRIEELEANLATTVAALKKLHYWFDTDQEIIDRMSPDEYANHMRMFNLVIKTLAAVGVKL